MTPYPHLTNYFWNEVPSSYEEDLFDSVPDYQRAIHSSPYCCIEEENSFPHLMPFLGGYSTPSPVAFTPRTAESQIHSSLPALPQVTSTDLRAGRYSLPEITSPDNPQMTSSPTTIALGYINSTLGTSLSIIEGEQSYGEESSECGSDGEDNDLSNTTSSMETNYRREAVGTLPMADEKDKNTITTTHPKKRQRTSAAQLDILEKVYLKEKLPSSDLRKELAEKLKMTPRRVQVWFQNKRAKDKRMNVSK
jgi:hypothetical protein